MKIESIFPIIIMLLSLFACAVYIYKRDWKHAIYWLSSFMIILSTL